MYCCCARSPSPLTPHVYMIVFNNPVMPVLQMMIIYPYFICHSSKEEVIKKPSSDLFLFEWGKGPKILRKVEM